MFHTGTEMEIEVCFVLGKICVVFQIDPLTLIKALQLIPIHLFCGESFLFRLVS
jgi:hypothetical protein